LEWRARTSRGLVRQDNEDSWTVKPLSSPELGRLWLAMVADGLGGHEGGEVASSLAVRYASEYLERCLSKGSAVRQEGNPRSASQTGSENGQERGSGLQDVFSRDYASDEALMSFLRDAIAFSNEQVFLAALKGTGSPGMGTTLTAVIVDEASGKAYIGHVGDSRAYLLSQGVMKQITEDHSVTGELVRQGTITEEDAMRHPGRNVLTKALGTGRRLEVSTYQERIARGDVILLSTDGLTSLVTASEIQGLITHAPRDEVAENLVELANSRGGYDNATVIILWPDILPESGLKRGEAS